MNDEYFSINSIVTIFWITSCHLSDCLLIFRKWNSASFEFKKFPTNVFPWSSWVDMPLKTKERKKERKKKKKETDHLKKMFCPWVNFMEKEKDGNCLVQVMVNTMDRVEQTNLNAVFFSAWFLVNVVLRYYGEAQRFSYWWTCYVFLDFYTLVGSIESMSTLFVGLWFRLDE